MTAGRIVTVAGVEPWVELGIGDVRVAPPTAGLWNVAKWDTAGATWSGTEPSWLDISCHVIAVDDYRGHDRTTDRWDAGTATLTVANPDGWADLQTAPVTPGVLALRPGRSIRWGIAVDGGPRQVKWRGVIDAQHPTYDGRVADTDTVRLDALDTLGDIGRTDLPAMTVPVGAGEPAATRVHRILDVVGFPASHRLIDAVPTPVTATDLAGAVYDQLAVVADSVGGAVFANPAGNIVLRHHDWQTFIPTDPPDAIIGNVAGGVCPVSWELSYARADMTTRAVVGAEGAAPIIVDDPDGITLYGIETGPARTDLVTVDTAALTRLANRLLATRGRLTMPRIGAVTIDAGTARAARDLAAAVDPTRPSRYRCVLERAGRIVFDRQMLATSVNHSWDAGSWLVRVGLDDAAPWAAAGGRWDGAYWNQATWAGVVADTRIEAV